MDAQNTRSLKIMTFSKLVDLAYDTNNYIIYVFLILDNDDIKRFGTKYLMCTQYPNWDHRKLNIARRTCGYIGSNFWNQGRTQEIAERKLHLD